MIRPASAAPGRMLAGKRRCASSNPRGHSAVLTIAVLCCLSSSAQERYVGDRIKLGLHASQEPASTIVRLLDSGAKLKLLEAKGSVSKVRTSDGTEGWVDSAYLSKEPPAAARLQQLQRELQEEVAARQALQSQFSAQATKSATQSEKLTDAADRESRLRSELKKARAALALSQGEVQRAEANLRIEAEARSKEVAAREGAQAEAERARSQTVAAQARISATKDHVQRDLAEAKLEIGRIGEQFETARSARLAAENERNEISRQLDTALEQLSLKKEPAVAAPVPSETLREVQRMAEENQRLKAELGVQAAALRAARDALHATPSFRVASDGGTNARSSGSRASDGWGATGLTGWLHPYLSTYSAIVRWPEWQWLLLGAGMLLAGGLGAYWIDWRNRRRHGGFRL